MGLAADLAFCNKKLEAFFVDILSSQKICRSLLKIYPPDKLLLTSKNPIRGIYF